MKKRIISLVLAIVLVAACLPANVFAAVDTSAYTNPTIVVESGIAAAGATVEVDLLIVNNPGVAGAKFTVSYDEELTLLDAVSGETFAALDYTRPGVYANPCNFTWDSENAQVTEDGVILTLTFQISEEARANDKLEVNVSYRYGDIYNTDLDSVAFDMVGGYVQVLDYVPGDVNSDGVVNGKDITLIRRFNAGGYDISIKEEAGDVNDDGVINGKDITLVRRFNAGGYDVELLPSTPRCLHVMVATEAKAPTCEQAGNCAYWYCSACKSYYADEAGATEIALADTVLKATGHTLVTVPGYAPDYGVPGLSDGIACSVPGCGYVQKAQEEIAPLQPDECYVSYDLDGTDEYLKQYLTTVDISKINANPNVIDTTNSGYELEAIDLDAIPGYEFQGWVDGYGEPVRTIAQGTTGNVKLIATWKKISYNVIFDSALIPQEKVVRTIDEVVYLPQNLEWDHYVFVGWSDASGRIIDSIKPGTKDITVHANWTSNRNQTKANDYLKDGPIIIEDEEAKKYYFVYDIGMILNVPLETIVDLGYRSSLGIEQTVTKKVTIGEEKANTLNEVLENATTNSSSWTLSKDWNELLTDITGGEKEVASNQTIALSTGTSKAYGSSGSTYVGESFHASEDNLTTAKTVTDDSYKLGVEAGVEASYGPVKASVSASAETAHSEHQEDYAEKQTSMSLDSTWNTTNSYNSSSSFTQQSSVSNSIMESAKDTWQHEISKSIGGSDSQTTQGTVSNTSTEGYSSTMKFHSVEEEVTVEKISSGADTTPGYYRYVLAGDFYVYAIVCYDVATGSYSVTNHSILADETRKFLDYSKNDPLYSDYNNGVLPFEVPIDVHNYIFDSLSITNGLIVDRETGTVTDYEGDAKNVCIPDYAVFKNGDGSVAEVVKITGFEADVFAGKSVEMVKLSRYITQIPEGAFAGCTELKTVKYDTLTHIGKNAFNGCTALKSFTVADTVTSLGENAFDGVHDITVNASKAAVVKSAVTSAAGVLTVNLSALADTLEHAELEVKATDSFVFNGYGKSYVDVSINSAANTTVINRVTLTDNTKIPLHLNSANVTLNQVKIENAPSVGLISEASDALVTLQGKISIATTGENAILTRNMTLVRAQGVIDATELNVYDKKVLVCGAITDEKSYLKVEAADQIVQITETDFENMLKSQTVYFDANGGTVEETSRVCYYGSAIGQLPVPTKDYYTFAGWYTDATAGTEVTAETVISSIGNMTVYAHWTQNPLSDWVEASEVPADAKVEESKWSYTLREYTTNAASSLSGWVKYDTKRTSWGAWSSWSTTNPTNGTRNVESRSVYDHTEYHYYRWTNGTNGMYTYQKDSTYYLEEKWFTYILPTSSAGTSIGYVGTDKAINLWCRADYSGNRYTSTTWSRSINRTEWRYQEPVYTYYYYRDLSLETTAADPTGQTDVTNVTKWVRYRKK